MEIRRERMKEGKEKEGNGGVKEEDRGLGRKEREDYISPLRTKIPAYRPANKANKIVKKLQVKA
jgi:hypothetical protein